MDGQYCNWGPPFIVGNLIFKQCGCQTHCVIFREGLGFPRCFVCCTIPYKLPCKNADVKLLFSSLNRINWADHRSLKMDMIEKLLVVARDSHCV